MSLMSITLSFLRKSWAVPLSMFSAFVVKYFFPEFSVSVSSFGDIYLSFFLLALIPYLAVSIITSISNIYSVNSTSLNMKKWFVLYLALYVIISGSAILIALGVNAGEDLAEQKDISEFVRTSRATTLQEISVDSPLQGESKGGIMAFLVESIPSNIFSALSKGVTVQIIVFSILFGISLGVMQVERKNYIITMLDNFAEPFRIFIDAAVLVLPIGIFFIMSKFISSIKDFTVIIFLWKFIVIIIISILFLIFLCTIVVWRKLKISYLESILAIKTSSIIALATSEPMATMPSLLSAIQEKTKLRKDSVALLIPLGISLFSFGAIFYYSFLTVFVAQIYSVQLDLSSYMIIILAVYFAAQSETVEPLASLPIIFIPLGLPVVFLTLFMVVIDWVTMPFRAFLTTIVNYTGAVLLADFEDKETEVKPEHHKKKATPQHHG